MFGSNQIFTLFPSCFAFIPIDVVAKCWSFDEQPVIKTWFKKIDKRISTGVNWLHNTCCPATCFGCSLGFGGFCVMSNAVTAGTLLGIRLERLGGLPMVQKRCNQGKSHSLPPKYSRNVAQILPNDIVDHTSRPKFNEVHIIYYAHCINGRKLIGTKDEHRSNQWNTEMFWWNIGYDKGGSG